MSKQEVNLTKQAYRIGVLTARAESALTLQTRLEGGGEFSFHSLNLPLELPTLLGLDALVLEDHPPLLDALSILEGLPKNVPPVLVLGAYDGERSSHLRDWGIAGLLPPAALTLEQVLERIIRERELERQNRHSERERIQGEQRLRLALESGRMGLWDWNTVNGDIEADERTLELFGLTAESFDGEVNTLFAGIHPQDLPGVMKVVNEALESELPYRADYRVQILNSPDSLEPDFEGAEGKVRWIRSQGHPYTQNEQLRVVGFVEDISAEVRIKRDLERLNAERTELLERRLETSQDRISRILNTLPVVVFALDSGGRFTLTEGDALEKIGLEPGELLGQNALEVYADLPGLDRTLERVWQGQEVTVDQNTQGRTFETHYTPVRDLSGKVAEIFGIAFDVTENRTLERERAAALAKAELLAALADVLFMQSSPQGVFEAASVHLSAAVKLEYTCLMRLEGEVTRLAYLWGTMPLSALEASRRGYTRNKGGLLWQALDQGEGVYTADYLNTPGHLDLELPGLAVGVEPVRGADGVMRATFSVGRGSAEGDWTLEERDLLARAARTVGLALERTEREAALEEARATAEVLAQLSDALQTAQTPDEVAKLAMDRLCGVLQAQALLFIQLEGDHYRPGLVCGDVPAEAQPFIKTVNMPLSATPMMSRVVQSGEALYLDDYALEPDALAGFPHLAMAIVPVCKPGGKLEGILGVWRDTHKGSWKGSERDLLRRAASTVGIALERSQFVESLRQRFDFALESAGVGLWEWDVSSGKQHWSPEQEKLFGLAPGSFDGSHAAFLACVFHEDHAHVLRRAETHLDPQGPNEFEHEFRVLHPQGVRWLYGHGRIERDEDGKALRITGINFDITERKTQQDILERTLARFARAQSAARGWVFEWDLQTDVVERSSGVSEVLGYSLSELEMSSDRWFSIMHPDDLVRGREVVARALESGGPYSVEYRVRHKDGYYLDVWEQGKVEYDASGRAVRIVASTVDISQRRAFEQALKESEEFANSVLASSPDCIKVLDPSGRILRMNNSGLKMMEIDDFDSVKGEAWASLWSLELNQTVLDAVAQALSGRTVHFQGQTATQKGTLKWWDVVVAPVLGLNGAVQRLVSVSRDMTAQREVFQALTEREAELRKAHEIQRSFVNDLAHELRTPLTAIGGNLELMLRYPHMTPEDRQEAISEALSESQRLGRLATDLLALARGDAGVELERSELELRPLLLEAWKETQRVSKGHTLELCDLAALEIEGHRDRLKQLVLILLDNALKYTPAPGRVALELTQDGPFALLKVMDSGPGIPEADLPRVFERFFRVRRSEGDPGGTGLGLPIAQWIALQHSGEIWLESVVGLGTTVFVRLPLLEEGDGDVDGDVEGDVRG